MFGAMAFSAKIATGRLSGAEVAMIRLSIGLLPCLLVPRYRKASFTFHRIDLLLYRGFFGGLAVMLYFVAIQHSNVGVATLLNYTAPIWSGTFSMIFIGERFSPRVLIPIPIAVAGIVMVVQSQGRPGDFLGFGRWELLAALSAVSSGLALTAMRQARRSNENSWAVYASFCLIGTAVNAPLAIADWKTPHGAEWIPVLATAVFACGAQLLMTFTLRWVDAMTVGVISQLAVIISMGLGMAFLGDHITGAAALGSLITIIGVAGVTWVTSLSSPPSTPLDEIVAES